MHILFSDMNTFIFRKCYVMIFASIGIHNNTDIQHIYVDNMLQMNNKAIFYIACYQTLVRQNTNEI